MRFWRLKNDEFDEDQYQQELQNNDSEQNQKSSEQQGNSHQNENQNQTDDEQNGSSEQNQESSQQQGDSQQSESQGQMNDEPSGSSEQSRELSQQSRDSQQSENQKQIDDGQNNSFEQNHESSQQRGNSQQSESQSQTSDVPNGNYEQNQEPSQQHGDSQQNENQSQVDGEQNNSSEQNQESSQQQGNSHQNENQNQTDDEQNGSSEQNQEPSPQHGDSQHAEDQNQIDNEQDNSSEQSQESSQQHGDSQQVENQNQIDNEQNNLSKQNQELSQEEQLKQNIELLKRLKKDIEEIKNKKAKKQHREKLNHEKSPVEESKEEEHELSEQTNNFLSQLNELPSFRDRDRQGGYSIDTESYTEVPECVIRTLITKFLNQRFCKNVTDLNTRSNSLEKSRGFCKWEVKDVIVHLQTKQVTKVLNDKYGYEYAQGKNQDVPLSFYFDMSGSMSSYTNMLAVIAIELLKKGVKVLVGFNETVNVQIESVDKGITVSELTDVLVSGGYWCVTDRDNYIKSPKVEFKYIEKNLDNYLIEKKAEKCVVFSDFDPSKEIINLSQVADVYWFCFEKEYTSNDVRKFNGFMYGVQNIEDLEQGLLKINEKRFEILCYTDNKMNLQKKVKVIK